MSHFTNNHRNPSAATVDEGHHLPAARRHQPVHHHREPKFTLSSYVRTYWMDWLTLACMGALGLGVYLLRPAPNRMFPLWFKDGEIVYPEYAYPLRKNIIPIWLAAFLAFTIPAITVILMQIRVRSFVDANAAIMGVICSLVTAAVFQVFIKWLIGGLRPHFYAVCKPNLALLNTARYPNAGVGFDGLMVDRSICTGDDKEINDALESFPSGHSTAAWAGFLFLSLYINGKLKVFSNYRPHLWKVVLFFAPLLGATLISGSLTIDEFHHYYDVIGGGIIGSCVALASYRAHYASISDFRYNHLPTPRVTDSGLRYSGESYVTPATRKAGWGMPGDNAGGAPGNAMFGIGGDKFVAPHQDMPI